MALLGDPTIQRILDEVNKAASGGILGIAGNYISEPSDAMTQFESQLTSSSENNFYSQDQAPLFYPTPEMFSIGGLTSFDNANDLNSLPSHLPMSIPSDFDLYSAGLYNTMPQSYLAPYENYHSVTKLNIKHQIMDNNSLCKPSGMSSTTNDLIFDLNLQQDYTTMQPKKSSSNNNINMSMNNHTTPQMTSIPIDMSESNDAQLTSEHIAADTTDTASLTMNLSADNPDMNSLPSMNNLDNEQQYPSAAGKIFHDPNPQIIQRKGSHSVTYKQNIIVRFLQPPPIPNAGPLIIKEVHAPQPSPLPPLVIKQRPTPPKTPPPLVIREKPPPLPSTLATKVITRQLPPEPAPPRAVIIERLPPLPSKPRDIIIERWLPYEIVNQKRKVIVQRAPKSSKQYSQPKNVIITYEPVHANIIRNFQKQSVTREDPQVYLTRYGSQLYEPDLVIQQARAVGVIEDLNPPPSFGSAMTTSAILDPDYELPTATITVDEDQREQNKVENNDKVDENNNNKQQHQQMDEEIMQSASAIPIHLDDNVQEEDVSVEENVTPFYMNSGESLQQTLRRLGIELPENLINEHNF
ncbi:unnamed protein product [Adineta steineri]|uniref:Uncharacterized protein n=1 Tax=Adineta steineri TaxID=433720 RepID=A0A814M647_9BILA|nr:unnamed protein product [Adineta steineri]CAF1075323.1 unnamed protein product [Adineta steineri]CAF3492620.1 unnamed protein product [Adineta steineri]CAF3674340.1 unnamed protein product [Adineta steineri]